MNKNENGPHCFVAIFLMPTVEASTHFLKKKSMGSCFCGGVAQGNAEMLTIFWKKGWPKIEGTPNAYFLRQPTRQKDTHFRRQPTRDMGLVDCICYFCLLRSATAWVGAWVGKITSSRIAPNR